MSQGRKMRSWFLIFLGRLGGIVLFSWDMPISLFLWFFLFFYYLILRCCFLNFRIYDWFFALYFGKNLFLFLLFFGWNCWLTFLHLILIWFDWGIWYLLNFLFIYKLFCIWPFFWKFSFFLILLREIAINIIPRLQP